MRVAAAVLSVVLVVCSGVAAAQEDGGMADGGVADGGVADGGAPADPAADGGAPADAAADGGAPELAVAPAPAPMAQLVGRVLTRGSITPVPGATVSAASGPATTTDPAGRFTLDLPAGDVDLAIAEPNHQILRVHEQLRPGEGLTVEYLLLPAQRRRFESTVRGATARHEGQRFSLAGEELHTVPGTLGDPFRAIALLPGVTQPVTLLPLYVVRGASPGMNGFFIDGMRVPQLFHLLVGGGVVNGRLVDHLDFYPSAYDASFGRFAGGIVDATTRPARRDGQHGEAQLRLYDVTAVAELALPHGVGVTASGSYGWPGLLIRLFSPGTDVQYADYQLRVDWKAFTLQLLGSYDSLSFSSDDSNSSGGNSTVLTYHRLQLRYHDHKGRLAWEAALVGGTDQMRIFGGNGVDKLSLSWRANLSARFARWQLQVGVDGELSRFRGERFPGAATDLGELTGDRNGVVAGAWAVATVDWIPHLFSMTLSARGDVYDAGSVTLVGIEPRLNLRAQLGRRVALHAGGGVYHQPPSFPVPLPGIDTFALQLGLQTAYHAALGAEATLPQSFTLSLTGYYQRFANIGDATLDQNHLTSCAPPPPEALRGVSATIMRQVDGQAYGAELLLRRHRGRVTGWIAYTVGRSERFLPCGARPSDFDQTHALNVVVQARLSWQLMLGGRLYVVSGLPGTRLDPERLADTPRNNWRLPTYVQLDLRLDREWLWKRWSLDLFVEVLNLTYSESAFGVEYPYDDKLMRPLYEAPRAMGFRWVLPTIGARGRF
jgi:hypothetical protein